ncbi:MAG: lipid-A-disaccharide synthase [Rickettsiales bacterium]|nr:lipid-A-disaccharide synthase [Pseudomonadota bacterium]MDA0966404.1 lipid-A-disaccharide synthase [Pseudomonadota bacterium]MDG4543266.1 lipid-A-disaccharide synthase [Rickettsiales bacterium]MDG4545532.1 lipid-A-disaccharide synthase [Rickettsiales bacterium]MDG4547981.1 lipid-A-disaccharide synthase [Rickettsiales bacterium]
MKIYIIAGEASGDIYGAKLIEQLKAASPQPIEFYGIGGEKMGVTGFKSLFDMSEISIMGFAEILPHLGNILDRIDDTIADIYAKQPDIVITIDSPGFTTRIAKRLRFGEDGLEKIVKKILSKKKQREPIIFQPFNGKLVHYVAPTVWAYKPKRAEKFAKLFDHLLVILPFEPPYFDEVGLPCTYIGHPIVETKFPQNGDAFKQKYAIADNETLISVMPGSRKGEVHRLLPIFIEAVSLLARVENPVMVIPTIPSLKEEVEHMVASSKIKTIVVDNDEDKYASYKAASVAIVKSGTGSLEVALAGCPMVIGYKVNYISYRIIKSLVKIKYANLINLILDEEIIPEFLQNFCTPYLISQSVDKISDDYKLKDLQIVRGLEALKIMGLGEPENPSRKAADTILAILRQ